MTPREIYQQATARGLTLKPNGEKITITPADQCPPDFIEVIKEHKQALLDWMENHHCPGWQAVPPNSIPLVIEKPLPRARHQAGVIKFVYRQTKSREISAWITNRENKYYTGPGAKWDCGLITYAACRDCARWQLNRSEADVWEFLDGCDEATPKK